MRVIETGGGYYGLGRGAAQRINYLIAALLIGVLTLLLAPIGLEQSPSLLGREFRESARQLSTLNPLSGGPFGNLGADQAGAQKRQLSTQLADSPGQMSLSEAPKRICLVTFEIAGPHLNGGVGTAFTNLALVLAKQGHTVTLVSSVGSWVSPLGHKTWDEWVEHFGERGVKLETPANNPSEPFVKKVGTTHAAAQSYAVYEWLRQREDEWDVIHFPESAGVGFFTVLAKHQKLYFRNTVLVVQTHGPLFWTYLANFYYPTNLNFVELDYLERKSMELCDVLLSPSHYMLEWLREYQWRRPAATYVVQNLLNHPDDDATSEARGLTQGPGGLIEVSEVVFFGRLEQRKGVLLFCEAVEALMREDDNVFRRHGVHLTFMGRATDDSHGREILKRIEALRLVVSERSPTSRFTVVNNFNTEEARSYLKGERGRLVVVPSTMENLPYTVMESIYEGIPLLASDVGGTSELFHEASKENLFRPDMPGLVRALRRALQSGIRPSKPAVTNSKTIMAWDRWHKRLQPSDHAFPLPLSSHKGAAKKPLISVVLATHNRSPAQLQQAIQSLRVQTYPGDRYEVILVDDGSTDTATLQALSGMRTDFKDRGWTMVHTDGVFPGAAKNAGAAAARGEYLLFMEDDSIASPGELSSFEHVMSQGQGDVLACGHHALSGDEADPAAPVHMSLVNPGGSWNANTLGDTNFMVRATVFRALGGFGSETHLVHEDWEFLNKAWLSNHRVELVPQALFWKRGQGDARLQHLSSEAIFRSEMRAFRPIFDAFGPDFPGPSLLELKGDKIESSKQPDSVIASLTDYRPYNGYKNLHAEAAKKPPSFNPTAQGTAAQRMLASVEWVPMSRVIDGQNLALPDLDYPRVDKQSIHPGPDYLVSKVWRSYLAGDMTMRVEAEYTGPAKDSDGVLFYVMADDVIVSEVHDLTSANRKVYFPVKVPHVKVGTALRLVADPKGAPSFDYLLMKFDISIAAQQE